MPQVTYPGVYLEEIPSGAHIEGVPTSKPGLGEKLLLLAAVLAVTHHVDHILRVDHSGWPLLPQITPFTFSLLVYPVFLSVFLFRSKPWFRVFGTGLLFLFTTLAHIFLETPVDQYRTWAYGSSFPGHVGQHNLTGQDSEFFGACAVVVTVLLSLTLFAALLSFIRDARRYVATQNEARDEVQIRGLIEDKIKAVRAKDVDGATRNYAPDVLSFDVVNALQYIGAEAIRKRLEEWFSSFQGSIGFEIRDLSITWGDGVAFSHSLNHVSATTTNSAKLDMWWRETACYRKIDGKWLITHQHSSVPFDAESGKASLDLKP